MLFRCLSVCRIWFLVAILNFYFRFEYLFMFCLAISFISGLLGGFLFGRTSKALGDIVSLGRLDKNKAQIKKNNNNNKQQN